MSAGKIGVMSFHNRQTHFPVKPLVTLNKMTFDYTAEMKFLGIQITDSLKWYPHIQLLAGKLSKVAFMIKSLKEILSPNLIRNFYFKKFHSKQLLHKISPTSPVWEIIFFLGGGQVVN
jgi:hypothetical protein